MIPTIIIAVYAPANPRQDHPRPRLMIHFPLHLMKNLKNMIHHHLECWDIHGLITPPKIKLYRITLSQISSKNPGFIPTSRMNCLSPRCRGMWGRFAALLKMLIKRRTTQAWVLMVVPGTEFYGMSRGWRVLS